MEDEGLLLSNQHLAPAAVTAWREMGVDVVRIHARWWEIAPEPPRRAPSGFNASNHNDPRYSWANLDNAVRMVRETGHARDAHDHRPGADVDEQRRRASATRAGSRADGLRRVLARGRGALRRPGRPLPDLERAQPAGLAAAAVGLRQPPAQLHAGLAARLPRAGARGRAADPRRRPGRGDRRGELAPIGNDPISRQHADQAAAVPARDGVRRRALPDAAHRACRGFKAAQADSFGYHPHPLLLAPDTPNPDTDEAQFADIKRLFTVLDRLRAAPPADRQDLPPDRVRLPDLAAGPGRRASRSRCRPATCSRRPTSRGSTSA